MVKRITFDRERVNIEHVDGTRDLGVSETVIIRENATTGIAARQAEQGQLDRRWYTTDGQLNPLYQDVVSKDYDPVAAMRQLDAMGIDCRAIIGRVVALMTGAEGGEATALDFATLALLLNEQIERWDFNEKPATESEDAQDGEAAPAKKAARLISAFNAKATPADAYEQQLRQWLGDYLK